MRKKGFVYRVVIGYILAFLGMLGAWGRLPLPLSWQQDTMQLIGIVLVFLGGFIIGPVLPTPSQPPPGSLTNRISSLQAELGKSLEAITAIEQAIAQRKELVDRLEVQRSIAEQAIDLSKEQVDAVAQILNLQLQKESGRAFRRDIVVNVIVAAIFFLLGYIM